SRGPALRPRGLGLAGVPAGAPCAARHEMVVCGIEEAARMFELAGATARPAVQSGVLAPAGTPLLEATGTGGALHRTCKMAQTLMEILSGISTETRALVDAARRSNPSCAAAGRRQNTPGPS